MFSNAKAEASMQVKRNSINQPRNRQQHSPNTGRTSRFRGPGASDYVIWIGFGGGALGAITVSLMGFFLALHPVDNAGQVRIYSAFANLLIILTSGWYYSVHHSPANTFHDLYGRRNPAKRISSKLIAAFAAATSVRSLLIDGAAWIENKPLLYSVYLHIFFLGIVLIWSIYNVIRCLRSREKISYLIDLPDSALIDAKSIALKKFHRLSQDEYQELARLIYQNETFRSVTFSGLVKVLWRAIIVVFIIQLFQTLVAML
jgi:hypothetical protein